MSTGLPKYLELVEPSLLPDQESSTHVGSEVDINNSRYRVIEVRECQDTGSLATVYRRLD